MKNLLYTFLIIIIVFYSCKDDDDLDHICTNNCTNINGKFYSLNNEGISNVKVLFQSTSYATFSSHNRYIREDYSDSNGNYNLNFYLKDYEIENREGINIGFYLKVESVETAQRFGISKTYSIFKEMKRDTTFNISFYIPKKKLITVNIKNYVGINEYDRIGIQTIYPFGVKNGTETFSILESQKFLDTNYEKGYTKYDDYRGKKRDTTLRIPVAFNEKNIIRVHKMKNGKYIKKDTIIFVNKDNIELTFDY